MLYQIRRIIKDDLNNSFLETLCNLYPEITEKEKAFELFEKLKDRFEKDYFLRVSVTEDGQVIGTATLVIDYKFIRNCQCSGRIENVSTRQGYEGKGVSSDLVRELIEIAKLNDCYKVNLCCSEKLIPFYENLGFKHDGKEMRLDLNEVQ